MQKCLYVFWPCWGSNKGNIQIIIIRDVVPWLICEGLNCLMISVSVWNEQQFQLRKHFNIISALELSLVTQGQLVIKSTCCVDMYTYPWGHIMKNQGYSVLTIYTGKPEIQVGKSNGPHYSIWDVSENMGCDLRWCNKFIFLPFSACSADLD